jgi:uncharacterized membrane protein YeaQ/YmgE (transglycosylase-associated protein family)
MYLILAWIVIALVAGFVADFLVGRKRNYERWELFVVGMIGSFVGGALFSIIAGEGFDLKISGLIGSIVGAVIVLLIYGPVRDELRKRNAPPPKSTYSSKSSSSGSGKSSNSNSSKNSGSSKKSGR